MASANSLLKIGGQTLKVFQGFSLEIRLGAEWNLQNLLEHANRFDLAFDLAFDLSFDLSFELSFDLTFEQPLFARGIQLPLPVADRFFS